MGSINKQENNLRLKELEDNEYFEPMAQQDQFNINEVFLDQTFIIDELISTLRGKIIDSISKGLIDIEPAIEEKAISFLVARILPYTSKLFSLSNLDEEKIREMVYEFSVGLRLELMYCEQYGINRKDRNFIHTLTVQTMEATVRRAKDGVTMKRMLSQHQIKEITSRMENPAGGSSSSGWKNKLKL